MVDMFNFMKKKSTAKTETPQQKAEIDSAVDKVLLGYEVGANSIATMVTGLERDGDQLTLDLRLPQDSDPETIQKELGQMLRPHGVKTIHMNVRLPCRRQRCWSQPTKTNAQDDGCDGETSANY